MNNNENNQMPDLPDFARPKNDRVGFAYKKLMQKLSFLEVKNEENSLP